MEANERQVGGSHYKTEYEHWDLAVVVQMGYLEGCATKYVARWRKKGVPLQDLEKALHYHDKLIETAQFRWIPRIMQEVEITSEVCRFVLANKLSEKEHEYIHLICTYRSNIELQLARGILLNLIEMQKDANESTVL